MDVSEEIEPLYRSGARVVVSASSDESAAQAHAGESGAVVSCFENGSGFGCEVLLDDGKLVELHERDLEPEI